MQIQQIKIKQALNKAYLREKVNRADIELFKTHFTDLLDKINDKADEEHLKSLIADFLKFTWYKDAFQINPYGKNDLVIHTGKLPADPIGVILEVKSLANKAEMISMAKPNAKAIHELILYYLNERITNNKHEIKQLIATNIYEWFVFDANEFDKKIYRNTQIKKLYGQKIADHKDNPWFYEEIKKLLDDQSLNLDATCFDIRDYKIAAKNSIAEDDTKLIPLYKILSPVHLLKLSFANDSNSLQPKFYSELLHLIGLYEYKEGSKKLISRKKEGERNTGSLLENAILNLERHDKILNFDSLSQYGDKYPEQVYNIALELVITWINRILFLKLLEAQLSNYHKGDDGYRFLNKDKIRDFKDLDNLFFGVLAIRVNDRKLDVAAAFKNVPYLNSSLFEITQLEKQTITIDDLNYRLELPILTSSILRNSKTRLQTNNLPTLDYLFEFLKAYDFSSEGAQEIQEENKPLVNASVLGLIFEKINGYKDGSFFTPGFITMYMCRETIRRAVVQKFNDANGWEIKEYSELYNKIRDDSSRKEANTIINSLKICDPAVGSGHFLVSALNEIIAIKSDLNIMTSSDGRTLNDYHIEVVNDELIVTDENNDPFKYNFHNARSQTVQQTLFHEKQTIIENCLFGVDINPNSVKICRLRLWIELLKNAYYKPSVLSLSKDSSHTLELETLPNIDINIKTGNSLISRFALDADLKPALKKNKITIEAYRNAVDTYRNAMSKEQKREMESIINSIKTNFRTEISSNSDEVKKLIKAEKDYNFKYDSSQLFENKLSKQQAKDKHELELEIEKYRTAIEEIKNNKIYENAFEWRFEFPEVLNEEGSFVGFDVVIGNPPYVQQRKSNGSILFFKEKFDVYSGTADLSIFFFERGFNLLRYNGQFSFINTNKFFNSEYGKQLRNFLINFEIHTIINFELVPVFDEALVSSTILNISKSIPSFMFDYVEFKREKISFEIFAKKIAQQKALIKIEELRKSSWLFSDNNQHVLIEKINSKGTQIGKIESIEIKRGITTGFDNAFIINNKTDILIDNKETSKPVLRGRDIHRYCIVKNDLRLLFIPWHFPLHKDSTINGASLNAEKLFKKQYLNLYNHLALYKEELSNRNKSETGIRYEWYALQRCAATYYELFNAEKIVWGLISGGWDFAYDFEGNFLTSASFFLVSKEIPLKFILGLFNSSLYKFYFSIIGELTAGSAFVFKKTTIEKFIIPNNWKENSSVVDLVDKIIVAKRIKQDTSNLESQIDQLVYQLYNLTPEEIKLIEGEV